MSSTVLHIIDTTGPGGAETVFTQLAVATQRQGIKTIALIRGKGWVQEELARFNLDTRIENCKGSFNISYLLFLIKLIRTEKISLIQSHLLGSSVYANLAGLITFTPVISTFHGHVDISPSEKFRFLKFLIIKLGSKAIVAVSKPIKQLLLNVSRLNLSSKIIVIPNGIDHTTFSEKLTKRSPSKDKVLTFGSLGNVRKAKNYQLAINFIQTLAKQGKNVKLIIAGDDTNQLAEELKIKIKKLKLEKQIDFVGFISETADFLRDIDVFLMTSSSEGHPLAITQALACKTPILSTPSGVEKVVSDEIIFISNKHHAESLEYAFEQMHEMDSEKMSLRLVKGRELVIEKYSQTAMLANYLKLYGINNE